MSTLRVIVYLAAAAAISAATKWTVDDVLFQERADQVELSPDGRLVVWVKSQMDREKGESVSHLILRNLAEDYEVQLTRGADNHSSPRFSPDGKRIGFLSARRPPAAPGSASPAPGPGTGAGPGEQGGGMQVWLIDTRGGEPYVLTRVEKGVRSFAWLDNDTLLVAAAEDASLFEQRTKERKDTTQVVDDEEHAPPVRLFRFEIKGRGLTRLTTNTDCIARMAVSDDGAWAVTIHDRSLRYTWDQKIRPLTFLHDLKKGTATQLFTDGKLLPSQIAFDLENKGFYFSAPYTTHPVYNNAAIQVLYYYELASAKLTQVPLDWGNALGGSFTPTPTGFLALLANGARHKAALYTRAGAGWSRAWIEGEHAANLFALEASRDGKTVLYRHSTASTPAQWYRASLVGAGFASPKAITSLNGGFKKKTIARTELVHWKGALDEQVEGVLYYPHDFKAGQKYALMVMIHGGPHGADLDNFNESWSNPVNLMAQRGAFVLKPNYHGSALYGLKWGESISGGNYNDLEWVDVERGVDSLIAKGLVDAARLGIMGWSNGSIITIEVTTRTTRYKAASAGAGDVNYVSDWGNCAFGHAFEHYYLGKTPLEDPQLYIKKSPLYRMGNVLTPTIIFFGTEDRQVPTEQGWQHYRALHHLGKTDVRFILFPGEAHSPRKLVHQRRKLEEELAWFDKYLFRTAADKNEALRPESPLSAVLKRKGQVPETVARGEIEIGRFEVTRAQFAAFDPGYKFPPATENHPASGIGFDAAKAYCAWLAKTTGRQFRLGTEDEMKEMLKASRSENTLDGWAAYAVNADDARRLASLVEGLGAGALLKPVGSLAGSGEDPLFDLGGNAAEWVIAKDGTGKALGGSADRPADPKGNATARPDYVGLRVVVGAVVPAAKDSEK